MFNARNFMAAKLEARTQKIEVPSLAREDFFWDCPKEERFWTVRGLTADEILKATEAKEQANNWELIAETFASALNNPQEKINALKDLLGIGDKIHSELAKAIQMVVFASVEPKITIDVATKLAKQYPNDFFRLKNVILELSGQGAVLKKSKPSTKIQKSS